MKINNQNCFEKLLILLTVLFFTGCMMPVKEQWPAIEGKVTEEGTNKPIEGAIVVVSYKGWGAYSTGNCFHVETATTDEKGIYRIPAWRNTGKWNNLSNQTQYVTVYKSSYKGVFRAENNFDHTLRPFNRTREERLEYLKRTSMGGCSSNKENNKKLSSFNRALLNEARIIAKTNADKKVINSLRYYVDQVELGGEEAQRRVGEGWYLK